MQANTQELVQSPFYMQSSDDNTHEEDLGISGSIPESHVQQIEEKEEGCVNMNSIFIGPLDDIPQELGSEAPVSNALY